MIEMKERRRKSDVVTTTCRAVDAARLLGHRRGARNRAARVSAACAFRQQFKHSCIWPVLAALVIGGQQYRVPPFSTEDRMD